MKRPKRRKVISHSPLAVPTLVWLELSCGHGTEKRTWTGKIPKTTVCGSCTALAAAFDNEEE